MVKVALWITLQCKDGKQKELEDFLDVARILAEFEPNTITWYAIKRGPCSYAIFDTFYTDIARQEHLSGRVADALTNSAASMLTAPPSIQRVDVVAVK